MDAQQPGSSSVDELVEQLRARVEERRRSGAYPPGLEHDLDAHYRHVAALRSGGRSIRERVDAVHDAAEFAAENIATSSRFRGGSLLHRLVAKTVARQTQGVLSQVRSFAQAVQDVLEAMVEPLELVDQTAGSAVSQQLEILHALIASQQQALNAQRADLVEIIDRRVREARPTDVAEAPFEPWYESERFEAAFRGSRRELLERYRDLTQRFAGCEPVLDIGFGRGELLQLLDELGVAAKGVETDPVLVKLAAERGFDAVLDDGNTYLRTLEDGALGGLALIQVVEHLGAQELVDLVALAERKVRPGGKVIIETVNPQSLYVFARSFYLDPTHLRPVHPSYLDFLFREAGFSAVEIEWRNPPKRHEILQEVPGDDEAARRINANVANLNALLFAAQDYAIIATR